MPNDDFELRCFIFGYTVCRINALWKENPVSIQIRQEVQREFDEAIVETDFRFEEEIDPLVV